MKVDSKHIITMIDTVRALLQDFKVGIKECDDVETVEGSFDYVHEQIRTVLITFKVDHLTPITKPDNDPRPLFVKMNERLIDRLTTDFTEREERVNFMARLYHVIKRKLKTDGVDHLLTREKIFFHIENYLVANDNDWGRYFQTTLSEATYRTIETVVDEIMEHRRKNPQLTLTLAAEVPEKANSWIDNIQL